MKLEVNKVEKVFELLELEEQSLYAIRVKYKSTNPEHKAFLFTGFKNGSYCYITSDGDESVDMMSVYSMKVIKKLCSQD